MNRKFIHLEYSALLDQLAHHTIIYTRLLNENGTSQEREECRQLIQRLLAEINFRVSEGEQKDSADKIIN